MSTSARPMVSTKRARRSPPALRSSRSTTGMLDCLMTPSHPPATAALIQGRRRARQSCSRRPGDRPGLSEATRVPERLLESQALPARGGWRRHPLGTEATMIDRLSLSRLRQRALDVLDLAERLCLLLPRGSALEEECFHTGACVSRCLRLLDERPSALWALDELTARAARLAAVFTE